MTWLLFSILVFLFTYLGQENITRNNSKYFRVLLVITLSYMIGFGGQLFTDHDNYSVFYKSFDGLSDYNIYNFIGKNGRFEFGFMLLAQIGHWLGLGTAGFLFMVSAITNTLMVKVFYRFKYPLLSVLIFITTAYYSQQANGVRQMLAVSVFLYSLQFLANRQTLKYLICILVATLFHFGSIILFIFALLRYVDLEKYFEVISTVLIFIWGISVLGSFGLFHLGGISIGTYFSVYEEFSTEAGDYDAKFNPIFNTLILLALLQYRKEHKIYVLIYAIACILLNFSMASDYGKSLYRLAYFFTPIFSVFSGELMYSKNYTSFSRYMKPILVLVTAYYLFRLFYLYIFNNDVLLGGVFYPLSDFFQ